MRDFSHWDFAECFSGYDAAALILGIEPVDSEDDHRVRVVVERLASEYARALKQAQWEIIPFDENEERKVNLSEALLVSVELEKLWRLYANGMETPLDDWIKDKRSTHFDIQRFDRNVIDRWLENVGYKSVYSFNRDITESKEICPSRWPWGTHTTIALGHVEAAARRYWMNYDPSDETSAPTNTTVSDWLQKERKVSKAMADSIASILRVDGLKTGPRT